LELLSRSVSTTLAAGINFGGHFSWRAGMPILLQNYVEFGKERKVVVIDKSDSKHPTRVVHVAESVDVLGRTTYAIKVAWTADEFHPTMRLSRDDVGQLVDKLKALVGF
jgi:cephalosporin hydroxylase